MFDSLKNFLFLCFYLLAELMLLSSLVLDLIGCMHI